VRINAGKPGRFYMIKEKLKTFYGFAMPEAKHRWKLYYSGKTINSETPEGWGVSGDNSNSPKFIHLEASDDNYSGGVVDIEWVTPNKSVYYAKFGSPLPPTPKNRPIPTVCPVTKLEEPCIKLLPEKMEAIITIGESQELAGKVEIKSKLGSLELTTHLNESGACFALWTNIVAYTKYKIRYVAGSLTSGWVEACIDCEPDKQALTPPNITPYKDKVYKVHNSETPKGFLVCNSQINQGGRWSNLSQGEGVVLEKNTTYLFRTVGYAGEGKAFATPPIEFTPTD
jgi:hypothetical protein